MIPRPVARGRRRRGRGRGRSRTGAEERPQAQRARAAERDAEPASDADDAERRRRRGRRGGRRKKRAIAGGPVVVEIIPGEEDELLPPVGDDGDLPELPEDAHLLSPPVALPARRGKTDEDEEEEEDAPRSRAPSRRRKNVILVNAADPEEMRVAVVEGTNLTDFLMTVRARSYVNDIYRGTVVNLEPAIGAAFVDFGEGRNGFLHTSDVLSAYGDQDWSLDKLLTTRSTPTSGSPNRDRRRRRRAR
jgi:hypothetical protein